MTQVIEAAYRVVTPLFCAGADPGRPELRLPSFKGVLRYWWRALAWPRFSGDLDEIRRHEEALFGSAAHGRSQVLMHLSEVSRSDVVKRGEVLKVPDKAGGRVVGEGARYLGYGVMEAYDGRKKEAGGKKTGGRAFFAGQLTRACFRAPLDFTVRLRCRPMGDGAFESLLQALKAVGLVAGMGAKSRKGYGSLVLESLRVDGGSLWESPGSPGELRERILDLLRDEALSGKWPAYTAFSKRSRHVLVTARVTEPLDMLDLVGREMMRYRSWGHKGRVLGKDSEKNFKDDHDLMKKRPDQRHIHPRRIAFGLPHNYGKHCDQHVVPAGGEYDRRASPLFIHIHQCGESPVAVLSFLPARFLPRGENGKSYVSVGGKNVEQKPEDELYAPVEGFLDRLMDPRRGRREPFTEAQEVRP